MLNKIKILIPAFILMVIANALTAQKQYLTTKDSDKEAVEIFNNAKKKLEGANSISIDFKMTMYQPDINPEIINGSAKQKGNKYYIFAGESKLFLRWKFIDIISQS
ncbi:MAG: hypothetical protein R2771_03390 [Saprospiraceae bacterium]